MKNTLIVAASVIAVILIAPKTGYLTCPIVEGDKVYNSAIEKKGTVRHLNPSNCRIGIMYNDNTVSQQFSDRGGVSLEIDYWTVNKVK